MVRDWAALKIQSRAAERVWTVEDLPVLRAASCLPEPEVRGRDGRITRFYQLQERAFYRFCEQDLLPWAEAAGKNALKTGAVPECREAALTWRETYRAGRLWSLCTVVRENAAPGPASVAQWGDVWDLQTGFPVPVSDCFPAKYPWRHRFFEAAEADIAHRERAGTARFYPGWKRGLRRYFSARRYYLTEAGVVFFYPLYTLAPASEGIPAFTLPWEGEAPAAPVR